MRGDADGDSEGNGRAGTPRRKLEDLQAEQLRAREASRVRLEAAVLEAAGELGYARLTVQAVLDRSGVGRSRFYREFANLAECFACAYVAAIERLCERLLVGCRPGAWRAALVSALDVLSRLLAERPLIARALVLEVHVAGEPALAKQREVWERLSRAMDGARRETDSSRHSPPPLTASFMVSAIEAAVGRALLSGDPGSFRESAPRLRDLIFDVYFG